VGAGVLVLVRRKWPHFSSRKYIDHGPFDCAGKRQGLTLKLADPEAFF